MTARHALSMERARTILGFEPAVDSLTGIGRFTPGWQPATPAA